VLASVLAAVFRGMLASKRAKVFIAGQQHVPVCISFGIK
jgi:hypothetical protein